FLAMAAAGNPSILLTLWAPVIETTELGHQLVGLRDAFVGRHVLPRYQGYMQSQVMRMQGLKGSGHGRRGGGKREELIAAHGYDTRSSPCTPHGSATKAPNSSPAAGSRCPSAAPLETGSERSAAATAPTTSGWPGA